MRRALGAQLALGALLAVVAGGVAGCGEKAEPAPTAAQTRDAELGRQLRAGGLVLIMRHAPTDLTTDRVEVLGDCDRQRNLSRAGRAQARAVGQAIRAAQIPIGEVRASPLCRARDTARLAFGRARVGVDRMLVSPGVTGTLRDDRRRIAALRRLATRRPARGNLVLVTHIGNLGGAFGEQSIQEGEVLVLRPRPGRPEKLRVLAPGDWREL